MNDIEISFEAYKANTGSGWTVATVETTNGFIRTVKITEGFEGIDFFSLSQAQKAAKDCIKKAQDLAAGKGE